ncbi:O-antigen ligase family protein [Sphingomicrobium marinum]|uniref:O-antigen ligase family protein n=1 Tax=Sphingomicrobium marinum TaxID=1227950 RepID=UPI0022409E89|nr:O-antigen ligase family protein [Sphingomicrobium marinum]
MGGGSQAIDRRESALVFLLAAAPALTALLTFDHAQPRSLDLLREFAYPVLVAELVVIIAGLISGALGRVLRAMPSWVQGGLLLLFVIMAIAASQAEPMRAFSLLKTSALYLHVLAGLSLYGLVKYDDALSAFSLRLGLLWGGAAFLGLVGIFAIGAIGQEGFNWTYFGLASQNIRSIASYAMVFAALGLGVAVIARGWERWLAVLTLVTALTIIFWSGSRGPALGWLAAMVVGLFVTAKSDRLKLVGLGVGSSVVAGGMALLLPVPNPYFGLLRLLGISEMPGAGDISSGRLELWRLTIEKIIDGPLFGHGVAQFIAIVDAPRPQAFPHNTMLQFLFNWGWIGGGIAIVLLAALALYIFHKAREAKTPALPGFLIVISVLALGMIDEPFYDTMPIFLFMIGCVLSLGAALETGKIGKPAKA